MRVRVADEGDIARWAEWRAALWPEGSVDDHRAEIMASRGDRQRAAAFVASDGEVPVGFAEASLRFDYVNGCDSSPVAFLEGIYVEPAHRGRGAGRALVAAVEAWGRARGCAELASDALAENRASHAFHRSAGFEETERVVYFRKRL